MRTDCGWRATAEQREESEVGAVLITVWALLVSWTLILEKGFMRIRQTDISHSNNTRTPSSSPPEEIMAIMLSSGFHHYFFTLLLFIQSKL